MGDSVLKNLNSILKKTLNYIIMLHGTIISNRDKSCLQGGQEDRQTSVP